MDIGVCLVNAVISLNNFSFASLTPYVGGGIGAAHLDITKANSLQVDPPESDINHFNSRRNDSPWNVKINNIHYNAFVIGLQYDL